jgi:nucleotide-binding universal stress UspA family protein
MIEVSAMRSVLAVIAFDESSVVALERAFALARLYDARLDVVHIVPYREGPLVEHEDAICRRVRRWATLRGNVVLDKRSIFVRLGDRVEAVDKVARSTGAQIIVVGASHWSAGAIARLVTAAPRGVLVAHPPRTRNQMIAATDLTDTRFPVIHTAAKLAEGLSARVTVVHNIEQKGQGPVVALDLDTVAHRLGTLERLARQLERVEGGHVASSQTTVEAILHVAQTRDADIAVVGIRPGRGRTLLAFLEQATCSVLAVPL